MTTTEIIYLDNNATTQHPAVIEEMLPFLTKYYGILPAVMPWARKCERRRSCP
jgi:cysteine sulfinate desulfinase/cysteine desulfurase-like protein